MERLENEVIEYRSGSYEDFVLSHAAKALIPIQAELEIISNCNFHCIHCYVEKSGSRIDDTTFYKISDQLKGMGCVWMLITGGEPLMHPDFFNMWRYAYEKGFELSLFTNGSLIDYRHIELFCTFPPETIEVTIYSLNNESQKAITGKAIDIQAMISKLTILKKKSNIVLKAILLTHNFADCDGIKELAKTNGFRFRMDAIIHPSLDGNTSTINYRIQAEKAAQLAMSDSLSITQLCNSYQSSKLPFETNGYEFPCSAGVYSFHIDSNCNLNMCSIYRNKISDLRIESFQEGWGKLNNLRSSRRTIRTKCDSCKIKDICSLCPAIPRLYNEKPEFIDEYICSYTKEIAKIAGIHREA